MPETNKKEDGTIPNEKDIDNAGEQPSIEGTSPGAKDSDADLDIEIDRMQKQLLESEQAASAYKDQLLRLAAEFDNFRKRAEAEKVDFIKFSSEKIIKDLLPILDDFNRALSSGKNSTDYASFLKGMEMIHQKLYKILEEKGLKPIESLGKEFDVTYHDVLMQIQRPDAKPHTIVEEVERGYTLHGKVIKHAKVIVASESKDGSEKEAEK